MREKEEQIRIGREVKAFLDANGIDRGWFAQKTGLGKSTLDKLITGMFSEKSLVKVLERSDFKLRTLYADKRFGGYSKAHWEAYISSYSFIRPDLAGDGSIIVHRAIIEWDNYIPALVLSQYDQGQKQQLGVLWIPHERSPLIYIQPAQEIGVRLVVSTMVGEPCMRGLMLAVDNPLANAWVPTAIPIVLKRLASHSAAALPEGVIDHTHPDFSAFRREIAQVVERQYGRLITLKP